MYEARAECVGECVGECAGECVGECVGECAGYGVGVPRAGPRTLPLSRPGCLVCPWAAARPLAVRAASFARCVVSKPGQALPPPTGTAARPSGSLRTGAGGVFLYEAFWWRVADVSDPRV